jgi:hypothetical protein
MYARLEDVAQSQNAAEGCSCPPWCEHEHLDVVAGYNEFHHDGSVRTVELTHGKGHAPGRLFVTISQHVQGGRPTEAAGVDLHDELRSVARLTPGECQRLSKALLDAAAIVTSGAVDSEE